MKRFKFTDTVRYDIVALDGNSLEKVRDDYPGAFKPPKPGDVHPTGLGLTVPGQGYPNQTQPQIADLNVQGNGLIVHIAATHAGLVTRNNGFYLPDKMRSGTNTWTEIYEKPLQVHHDEHKDPVGRIKAGMYRETIGAVLDRFQNHVLRDSLNRDVGRADEQFWKDFCSPDTSFIEKINMIKVMDTVLFDKHYQGVGYIELIADVTDPDAIQKVLDGRFLTGSVGATSDKAVCSVCATNWLEEEHCGHRPGKVYDGKKCFVIAGDLDYEEYSFVNAPADRHSGILSIQNSYNPSVIDAVKGSGSRFYMLPIRDYFHEEEQLMQDGQEDTNLTTEIIEVTDSADSVTVTSAEVQDSTTSAVTEEVEKELTIFDKVFVDDSIELTDEEEAELYAMLADELENKDKTLSSQQRKNLPRSAFCGPDRSFPVPDCAHVTAARRLVGRYKGPGSKDTIMACVDRKARALGCDSKKDSVEDSTQEPELLQDSKLSITVMSDMLNLVDAAVFGEAGFQDAVAELSAEEQKLLSEFFGNLRKRFGKDAMNKAFGSAGIGVAQDELDKQVQETERLEDELADRTQRVNDLRTELNLSYTDFQELQDKFIQTKTALRKERESRLTILNSLADASFNKDQSSDFVNLTDEVLEDKLESALGKVDMKKITDKVFNGQTSEPVETVENPVGVKVQDNFKVEDKKEEEEETQPTQTPTYLSQKITDENYRHILINLGDPAGAKEYYQDQVKKGLAKPKDF